MGSLPSTTTNGIVSQSQVSLVKWSMPIRARDRYGPQRQPACLCHHNGEAKAAQPSTSLMHSARRVVPITAELDRRPTGQHAINFCRAPQRAYTPCGTDAICSATRGRAPCNGSLTDHIVRVSLDPDVFVRWSHSIVPSTYGLRAIRHIPVLSALSEAWATCSCRRRTNPKIV